MKKLDPLKWFKYSYVAEVTCVDGTVVPVSGTTLLTTAMESPLADHEYLVKCGILLKHFQPGQAVGTNNVKLLEMKFIEEKTE